MRCWLLMLLLVFHHGTDFLSNDTRSSENFSSLCDSNQNHRKICDRIPKRLSLFRGGGHMQANHLTTADCNTTDINADSSDVNSELDIVPSATLDENQDVLPIKASKKPNETVVCRACDLPAKIDSFEKWKHSQLSRYLNEQRKQKQSANSQTPGKTSQEGGDKIKNDDPNNLPSNLEQHPRDSEAGSPSKAHSNDKTSNLGNSNSGGHQQNDGNFGNHHLTSLKKTARQRKNFANANCGAKIVATNEQAQNAKEILSENRDGYMLNPCKAKIWFIVELCERIQIESLELASFELFARVPKRFKVSATEEFEPTLMNGDPASDSSDQHALHRIRWYDLGTFVFPSLKREIHRFNVSARHVNPTVAVEGQRQSSDSNAGCSDRASSQQADAHCENVGTQNSHGDIYELIHKLREEPYVKYVRFEMLEYEGTEHYCPLSLVRVYGSTLEEVINMHEQVDDSLIDALVSMPDSVGHASTISATARAGRDIVNSHDPSSLGISHYMFMLVQDVEQKRQISLKHWSNASRIGCSDCTFFSEDCANIMSDVDVFKILCTKQLTLTAESLIGDKKQPELSDYTNEGFGLNQINNDDSGVMDKSLRAPLGTGNSYGQRDDSVIKEVLSTTVNYTQEDRNDQVDEAKNRPDLSVANEKPVDLNQSDPTMRRENISNLKTAVPPSNGLSNQPVLVRYGNRLNLLELNTTLYAIYLDQLSQHYNAHMQDLTVKLQQVSSELKIQIRRNQQLSKLVEQQAMSIELLEHRLRGVESKLYDQRYYYNEKALRITLCCTVFVCLLTLLLSAALNSHQLFRACGQERCTVPTSASDLTIEDQVDEGEIQTVAVVDLPQNTEHYDDLLMACKPALTIENALVVYLPKTVGKTSNGSVSALTGSIDAIRVSPTKVDKFGESGDKDNCLDATTDTSGHTFVAALTEVAGTADHDCYVIQSKESIGGRQNGSVVMQPLGCV